MKYNKYLNCILDKMGIYITHSYKREHNLVLKYGYILYKNVLSEMICKIGRNGVSGVWIILQIGRVRYEFIGHYVNHQMFDMINIVSINVIYFE